MAEAAPAFFLALFDALETGLILLDRQQRVALWNSWFVARCGIDAKSASGRSFDELFPGSRLEPLNSAISSAFESGVPSLLTHSLHRSLFPLKTPAGRTLVHDVMVSAVGSGGSPICLVQVVDVTIAAERDLILRERQNARYEAVISSAADLIVTLDTNGIIQQANPAAQKQFGYASKELEGQPASVLFSDLETWERMRRAVTAGETIAQPVELDALRKDGSRSYLEVSLSRWRSDSRTFVTAILRDVNERRAAERVRVEAAQALLDLNATLEQRVEERTAQLMQVEEALRQSQKMEALGQLTGGIAHDFNNLLQGIMGSLTLIQKYVAEGKISAIGRFVEGAMTSANRASALTNRLLAFARRQPIDPKAVNPNTLIASMQELLRRSVGETIELRYSLREDLWLVRCDSNQLENALLNLAINGRDAMPDGGTLTVETNNMTVNAGQSAQRDVAPGDYVAIRVKDTGVGMPADVKARAFDPFFTTKPIGQGTGLGLSMIYGFVRQSEGTATIDSEPGKGTAIELLLPRHHGHRIEPAIIDSASREQRSGHNEVVLVVEDEALVRLLIVEVLKELEYFALEASDGSAALRILQSAQRIDLLVTDIGLPGLNGRQLADAARINRPNLKILFMTGYAETAAAKSFLAPGMEIITKPFDMDALADRVRDIIEGNTRTRS